MPNDPVTVSISSQSGFHPEEIAQHSFPSARRGLDPDAVRRYLETLASEMQLVIDREQSVRRRVAELERAVAEPPKVDQQTILRAVGAETTKILETAHQAAADVTARAEAEAAELEERAAGVLEERTREADEAAAAILEEARAEAATVENEAHDEAVALLEATRGECRRIVRQARDLRGSILADLTEKRRELRVQLEQLRGARDSLLEMLEAMGEAVEEARERVVNAEHEARVAAAEAGDAAELLEEDELEDEEAEERLDQLEVEVLAPLEGAEGELTDESAGEEAVSLLTDEALAGELYDEEAAGGEPSETTSRRNVDELFARIRAGREEADSESDFDFDSGDDSDSTEAENGAGILGSLSAHEAAVSEADGDAELLAVTEAADEPDETITPVAGGDEEAGDVVAEDGSAGEVQSLRDEEAGSRDDEDESEEPDDGVEEHHGEAEDEGALSRRAALLDPVTDGLSRALKRTLREDQNLVLDALRNTGGASELSSLLPEDEQLARVEAAAGTLLGSAWEAGHGFLSGGNVEEKDVTAAGERLAGELARELTGLLRARLSQSLDPSFGAGEGAAEAAGAAFREWRGSRIESIAADFSVRAFSDGCVVGGNEILVRWVVDDEGRPCPDCDDNALAGPVAAGEEFPTGHVHPPVHPGCRCLLVAVTS